MPARPALRDRVARGAAEPYRPMPTLVEAARKEGQVLWYTTLIVDQIVRPLIKAFQAQVPGVEVKFVRIDSGQQVMRLINEARVGRVQADVWSVIDGVAPLTQGNVAAPFDIASARGLPPTLVDPQPALDRHQSRHPLARLQHHPGPPRAGAEAATRTCSIRAGRARSSGIRTP